MEIWRNKPGRDDLSLAAALGSSPDAARRLAAMVQDPGIARIDSFVAGCSARAFHDRERRDRPRGERRPDGRRSAGFRPAGRPLAKRRRGTAGQPGAGDDVSRCRRSSARRRGCLGFWGGFWRQRLGMVETIKAEDFLASWEAEYRAEFPQHAPEAVFFLTAAGPAAFRVC